MVVLADQPNIVLVCGIVGQATSLYGKLMVNVKSTTIELSPIMQTLWNWPLKMKFTVEYGILPKGNSSVITEKNAWMKNIILNQLYAWIQAK